VAIFPTSSSEQFESLAQKINLGGGLSNRQKALIVVFVVAVVATGLVLYFGFFSASSVTQPKMEMMQPTIPGETTPGGTGLTVATGESQTFNLEGVSLDFSVFDNETFKGLQEFGNPLDLSGEKGRDNPFIPY
jgi:hypothetical protein